MSVYETGVLKYIQSENMKLFLDNEIGTDYEVNNDEPNEFNIVVFDLTEEEVDLIRDYERNRLNEEYEKFRYVYKIRGDDKTLVSEFNDDYLAVEDKGEEISEFYGPMAMEYRFIDSNLNPHEVSKNATLAYIPGEKVSMFDDEPALTITNINFFSDRISYDLLSDDASIDRRNISAEKFRLFTEAGFTAEETAILKIRFLEINDFIKSKGHEPSCDKKDVREFQLGARLKHIREDLKRILVLKELDSNNVLGEAYSAFMIDKHETKLNESLKRLGLTVSINETDDLFIDCDKEDPYFGRVMFEAVLNDKDGEAIEDSITGRYCDVDSVISEISCTVKDMLKSSETVGVADIITSDVSKKSAEDVKKDFKADFSGSTIPEYR